jgi:biofilm PGA synthesis protein PgaA
VLKKKVCAVFMAFHLIALYEPAAYCQDKESMQNDIAGMEQKYQKALKLSKQNKADEALDILDELHRTDPNDVRYLYDYVAIASWNGRHDLVIAAKGLDPNVAPAYVLEALAASQRQTKNYEASLNTYDLVIRRFPERVEAQVAKVNTLIDAKRFKEAEIQLAVLQKKYPGNMDVMECVLRLSDSVKPPIYTLREAEKILAIDPRNNFALRMRFYALRKLGAAHLAVQLTPKSILSEAEQIEADRDRLAYELRWAGINADRTEQASRWKEMDTVITKLGAMCKLAITDLSESEAARGGCGDLVVALSNRRRMSETIALYDYMMEKKWDILPYVQIAAAAAYLDKEQPEKAQALYESALLKDPGNFEGRIGYIYALLDSEQYKEADRQIDRLAADTNEWIYPQFTEIREPNPNYLQAQLTSALIRSYTNRLSEAESRLQLLAMRAPYNSEIRQGLASTYNSRGWPRRAESSLQWLDVAQPANVWTKLGLFENRMAIGDFENAEPQLNDATHLAPEERSAQKAQREWGTHNLPELTVESEIGKSNDSNSPNGSRDVLIDAHLYSRPLNYSWRAFAHTQLARSTYSDLTVNRNTVGGGVEYRIRDLTGRGELFNIANSGIGYALGGDYYFDDHWIINGLAENKSLSAPVRANADGVTARNIQVAGEYRWHESRNVRLNINQMNFSDGNRRNAIDAFWTEGLLTSATYILDSTVEYYASRNSSQSTQINYFNPKSDRQIDITFRNEWSQYHRYEKSLKHVLSIALGNYAQENYAAGSVEIIQYDLQYSPNDRLQLHFGIGRTLHPYDGVRDSTNAFTFGTDWRF